VPYAAVRRIEATLGLLGVDVLQVHRDDARAVLLSLEVSQLAQRALVVAVVGQPDDRLVPAAPLAALGADGPGIAEAGDAERAGVRPVPAADVMGLQEHLGHDVVAARPGVAEGIEPEVGGLHVSGRTRAPGAGDGSGGLGCMSSG